MERVSHNFLKQGVSQQAENGSIKSPINSLVDITPLIILSDGLVFQKDSQETYLSLLRYCNEILRAQLEKKLLEVSMLQKNLNAEQNPAVNVGPKLTGTCLITPKMGEISDSSSHKVIIKTKLAIFLITY